MRCKGIIAYDNGEIEEIIINKEKYMEAMREFHRQCNKRITLKHRKIKQTLLTKEADLRVV